MAGTVLNLLLLGLLFAAALLCVIVPLGALAIMFWHWHKELTENSRLRQARSTQIQVNFELQSQRRNRLTSPNPPQINSL